MEENASIEVSDDLQIHVYKDGEGTRSFHISRLDAQVLANRLLYVAGRDNKVLPVLGKTFKMVGLMPVVEPKRNGPPVKVHAGSVWYGKR